MYKIDYSPVIKYDDDDIDVPSIRDEDLFIENDGSEEPEPYEDIRDEDLFIEEKEQTEEDIAHAKAFEEAFGTKISDRYEDIFKDPVEEEEDDEPEPYVEIRDEDLFIEEEPLSEEEIARNRAIEEELYSIREEDLFVEYDRNASSDQDMLTIANQLLNNTARDDKDYSIDKQKAQDYDDYYYGISPEKQAEIYLNQKREQELPHKLRMDIDDGLIVTMKDSWGMTLRDIAKLLHCSPSTVRNRYNKAKGIK